MGPETTIATNNEPQTQSTTNTKTIIVGLSGPSSSGKTTLARLLRSFFSFPSDKPPAPEAKPSISIRTFILHEDDFYVTDEKIPIVTTSSGRKLQDWDCIDALDLPLFSNTLQYIHTNGSLPPDLYSKEEQNSVGSVEIPSSTISNFHSKVEAWLATLSPSSKENPMTNLQINIFILDGFLLYPSPPLPPSIPAQLDLKLFLRSTHSLTKSRREARSGYVTLEGFWEDPPGYVDEVVWPNYVRDHLVFFTHQDVENGKWLGESQGVKCGPGKGEVEMGELLSWGFEEVKMAVDGAL